MKSYSFLSEFSITHLAHETWKKTFTPGNKAKIKDKYHDYKMSKQNKKSRPDDPEEDQQDEDNEEEYLNDD